MQIEFGIHPTWAGPKGFPEFISAEYRFFVRFPQVEEFFSSEEPALQRRNLHIL